MIASATHKFAATQGGRRLPTGRTVRGLGWALAVTLVVTIGPAAYAQSEGQADLDEATQLKFNAQSMEDLEKVVEFCESALQKGLDDDSALLAKSLLTSTLYQHASRFAEPIFTQTPPSPRWPILRQFAMRDLDKALSYDQRLGEVHMLVARLESLPDGNLEKAKKSAEQAVELFKDDKDNLSSALVVRSSFVEDLDQRMADLNRAIELNPRNLDAWRARAAIFARQGKVEEAINDFAKLLEQNPDDVTAHQTVAKLLLALEKYDEALEHVGRLVSLNPESSVPYRLRAGIHLAQNKPTDAIQDLKEALDVEPKDYLALLFRSEIYQRQGNLEAARADVERALEIEPNLPQAVLQRSLMAAAEGQFQQAIDDLKLVMQQSSDMRLKAQLANLYVLNQQPSRAIAEFSGLLEDIEQQIEELNARLQQAETEEDRELIKAQQKLLREQFESRARRGRGDAYLSVGKQAEAISDYEQALKLDPEDSGLLNNLAWVFATSPDEKLRDGRRAVELAVKACDVTEYKAPHILSTLAASHAEAGDFEKAREWSSKAVEIDEGKTEQLAQELESYKQNKPWRKLQQLEEENEEPPQDNDLEVGDTGDGAE